jgi:hypothetical protein
VPAAERLATLAVDLLASLDTRLPDLCGVPSPTRQYVHVGLVAYDLQCGDQLVVALERGSPGPVGQEQNVPLPVTGPNIFTAQLAVHLVRCVPSLGNRGAAPSSESLQAAGIQQLTDVLALRQAAREGYGDGDWGTQCNALLWGETVPNGPAGGVSGVIMRLLVQV